VSQETYRKKHRLVSSPQERASKRELHPQTDFPSTAEYLCHRRSLRKSPRLAGVTLPQQIFCRESRCESWQRRSTYDQVTRHVGIISRGLGEPAKVFAVRFECIELGSKTI
jgi:hypothetical protein